MVVQVPYVQPPSRKLLSLSLQNSPGPYADLYLQVPLPLASGSSQKIV